MDTPEILMTLGISLGLGLLVGLQRQRKGEAMAGIRTFALIAIFGTIAGLVDRNLADRGGWIVPAGALAVAAMLVMGGIHKARIAPKEIGLTTEAAALVMYGLGAYLVGGDRIVALVVGASVALLLHWKGALHGFVRRIGDQDMSAMMQFVLIVAVIWPVLPNRSYGPYGFFNPFETWLVVVLVVGISLVGYVLYKLVPPTAGALIGGIVGGLISSTATTVSYARRSREVPSTAPLALQAILIANFLSVVRVMVLLLLFAGGWGPVTQRMLPPLATMAGFMALLCGTALWMGRREKAALPPQGNPTELKPALIFAAVYVLVKLATRWGNDQFGAGGLYVIGALSGLTDMDAITLSISRWVGLGPEAVAAGVAVDLAWRVILVAVLSNLLFKAGCVLVLGNAPLRRSVAVFFGLLMAGGAAILLVWPR